MKKTLTVLMAVAVLGMFTLAATAQDSIFYLDVRDNSANPFQSIDTPVAPFTVGQNIDGTKPAFGAPLGGAGNGQVLRLNPVCTTGWEQDAVAGIANRYPNFDGDGDLSTGAFNLWMVVNGPFGTGDVISSIGLDFVTASAGVATLNYTWITTAFDDPSNAGKVAGAQVGDDWTGIKAVKVPVIAGPSYNVGGGLTPSATPVLLGRFDVTAGGNAGGLTSIDVDLNVNNLLVTRTFSSGGDPNEMISLGYDDTAGVLDAAVNGGVAGGDANPEAVIEIRVKGDGNNSGATDGADIGSFKTSLSSATATQEDLYLYDFNSSGAVDGGDIGGFKNAISSTCP